MGELRGVVRVGAMPGGGVHGARGRRTAQAAGVEAGGGGQARGAPLSEFMMSVYTTSTYFSCSPAHRPGVMADLAVLLAHGGAEFIPREVLAFARLLLLLLLLLLPAALRLAGEPPSDGTRTIAGSPPPPHPTTKFAVAPTGPIAPFPVHNLGFFKLTHCNIY